ncbi:MAG: insulinase family protein [Nitrospinae bacterium]|nr:insulinase family protein [Nitrospinota bacterium]
MKYLFYLLLALIINPVTLSAAEENTIKKVTLKNGFELITVEDHRSPIATFQVWYKVGSKDEEFGKTGMSHMLEHLMFKGTKKFGKGEYSRLIALNGGNENAFTSKDYTAYFASLSSDRIQLEIELEADRMQNLLLNEKEFLLERDVVAEERRLRTDDNPSSKLHELMEAAAYQQHPYHWPIIGWMDDIQNYNITAIKSHYKKFYAPNNAIGVAVGDFKHKDIQKLVEKYFGKIPPSKELTKERRRYKETAQSGEKRVYLKDKAQIPYVFTSYHAVSQDTPDSYALSIISTALSSGMSSRLYKRLVRKDEMCLSVDASFDFISYDPGLFTVYAGLRPDKNINEYEKILEEELTKIKKDGLTKRELQKAINQAEAEFLFAQDSIFYQAMKIGWYETVGMSYTDIPKFVDNIRKVTNADIKRVAKKYFVNEKKVVGILTPEKK